MGDEFVADTAIPLLSMKDSACIMISTVKDDNNFMSRLAQAKHPDGTLVFNSRTVNRSCVRCRALGQTCTHASQNVVAWHSSANRRLIVEINKHMGTTGYRRELLGEIDSGSIPLFERADVDPFMNAPLLSPQRRPRRILVTAADPSGGGPSATSAVTLTFEPSAGRNGAWVIVGIFQFEFGGAVATLQRAFMQYLKDLFLRFNDAGRGVCNVFAIEGNSDYIGQILSSIIPDLPRPWYLLNREQQWIGESGAVLGTQGLNFATVEANKLRFALEMQRALKTLRLRRADLLTLCRGTNERECWNLLDKQMRLYKQTTIPANGVTGKPKTRIGMKLDGQNDLIMALQFANSFALHWERSGFENNVDWPSENEMRLEFEAAVREDARARQQARAKRAREETGAETDRHLLAVAERTQRVVSVDASARVGGEDSSAQAVASDAGVQQLVGSIKTRILNAALAGEGEGEKTPAAPRKGAWARMIEEQELEDELEDEIDDEMNSVFAATAAARPAMLTSRQARPEARPRRTNPNSPSPSRNGTAVRPVFSQREMLGPLPYAHFR